MKPEWKTLAMSETRAKNVCSEYTELMNRAETKEEFIAIYKRGIDWSLENQAPSLDLLRREGKGFESNGLFIDKEFHGETLIDQPVYIFQHCKGRIRVGLNIEKQIIPMLYFANGCEMEILGIEGSSPVKVPVYIFGNNRVLAETSDSIQCRIYQKEIK